MRRRVVGCARVVACCALVACTYKPGAFAYPGRSFPGQRATLGCLDVAVDRRGDLEGKAVLDYQFGNRCDRPVTVDLARAAVVGRTIDGTEVELRPFDPAFEIVALRLDGRLAGGEAIAYRSELPLAQVCVDVATIAGDAATHWMCFGDANVIAAAGRAAERPPEEEMAEREEEPQMSRRTDLDEVMP